MTYEIHLSISNVTVHLNSLNISFKTLAEAVKFARSWGDPEYAGYVIEVINIKTNKVDESFIKQTMLRYAKESGF